MRSLKPQAGAGGGLAASVATCPLDVIKTKLQAQRAVRGQHGYQGVIGRHKSVLKLDLVYVVVKTLSNTS
jgi:solute carrier family 25 (mitochondrial folate transporter), member 32